MCASFNRKPFTTSISYCNSTNASDEMNIITFYNELSSLVHHNSNDNVLIIDINAHIAKDGNIKFHLPNSPNRNGEFLADFSLNN